MQRGPPVNIQMNRFDVASGQRAAGVKMRLIRKSPALLVFVALYVAAQTVLLIKGNGTRSLLDASIFAILCLLTRWFTRKNATTPGRAPAGRLIAVQMLMVAVVIVATALDGGFINHVTPAWLRVPLWSNLHDVILAKATPHIGLAYANGVANLVLYCVPIAIVLLVLGVSLAQQGLGRFQRGSLASAIAWLLPPLCLFSALVITGRIPLMRTLRIWLNNLMQNGVSEEFLWRGAILGRLRALMSAEHAIYLQAWLFGLVHLGLNSQGFKGDILGICADMIVNQVTFGLAMGYVTLRTGNIAIGSAFHMFWDSIGDVVG